LNKFIFSVGPVGVQFNSSLSNVLTVFIVFSWQMM
jgi:hypothetical protein